MLTIVLLVLLATLAAVLGFIVILTVYFRVERIKELTKDLPRTKRLSLWTFIKYVFGFLTGDKDVNYGKVESFCLGFFFS